MSLILSALPGPLLLFVVAVAVAILCYLVHRWPPIAGLVAAVGCLGLFWLSLHAYSGRSLTLFGQVWATERPFVLLGRAWAFTPSNAATLTLLLFVASLLFLLSLPGEQGWAFYPVGTAVVAVLILAVTAQQYIYAILFLWLAANLAVFVLSGGRPGATIGALRFLAFTSLAVMPLLILPRYLEPGIAETTLQTASLLMVIGFGILLMLVPFHGQLIAIAAHTAPMVPAFVLSVFPMVILYILFTLRQDHPALFKDQLMYDACRLTGIAAVGVGGIAAPVQKRWGYLAGYAMLVDWGAGLIALGQGTDSGIALAVEMLVWRAMSLLLVSTGTTILSRYAGQQDEIVQCGGALRRRPLGVLLLAIGLLSLAAFPLTPGAAGRWPLILALLDSSPRIAWVLILAGAGVSVGTIVGMHACVRPPPEENEKNRLEVVTSAGFALLALWIVGTLFFHPLPWLDMARRILGDFISRGT